MSYSVTKTVTRRILRISISEVTPKVEEILTSVIEKFKHHGVELVDESMGDNQRGSDFIISLGDAQEDDACEMAYYVGKALERAFEARRFVFMVKNKKRGWELRFNSIEGLELLEKYNECINDGHHFDYAGLSFDPKDSDLSLVVG